MTEEDIGAAWRAMAWAENHRPQLPEPVNGNKMAAVTLAEVVPAVLEGGPLFDVAERLGCTRGALTHCLTVNKTGMRAIRAAAKRGVITQ